jgi:hypothetical protein
MKASNTPPAILAPAIACSVWTASQHELSTHVQLAILKDISATLLASEWPQLVVTGKSLRFFRKGILS